MVLDLYLFRHGESEYNVLEATERAIIGGRSPHLDLTERGKAQARVLGEELRHRGVGFDHIYASPTVRAQKTARIVAGAIGFPADEILTSEALHEVSNGDWEGRCKDEVYTDEIVAKINTNNWEFCPPGGESQREVGNRMYNFVYKTFIKSQDLSSDKVIGLFTHGTAMKDLKAMITTREIMGVDEEMIRNAIRSCIENCAIVHFKYIPNDQKFAGWHEISWNEYGHLHGVGFKQEGYYPGRKVIHFQ
ncbi:MAG: histidine phosphatase family protein [Nanoarchaeota archaeon]|nr:histidine phosphatase family protein [Nanoarchaeota archaeon]